MKKLSIIIPVFNEVTTVAEIVDRVRRADVDDIEKEIIIVDDLSDDGTREILKQLKRNIENLTVIYHETNRGKGAAIQTAKSHVAGDIVILQDADLEYDPNEYECLIKPILENGADVVYGSRFLGSGPHRVLLFWHYVGNKILTTLSNVFTNLNLTDMETGYKVFRSEVFRKISVQQNRFGFEPEITAKVARLHCRVYEVGISYYGRAYAEGKKANWKDGIVALWCILKYGLFK